VKQALYRWFNDEGVLLYVGISSTLPSRVKQHSKASKWFDEASFMTIEWHENRGMVELAEKLAIKYEAPFYNIVKPQGSYDFMPLRCSPPKKTRLPKELEDLTNKRQEVLDSAWQKTAKEWEEKARYWERRLLFQMPAKGWSS
jgi:excinuclease UvrABC nuclease subunit